MLDIAALFDDLKESFQVTFTEQLRQAMFPLRFAQAQFPSRLLADVEETVTIEPLLTRDPDKAGDNG